MILGVGGKEGKISSETMSYLECCLPVLLGLLMLLGLEGAVISVGYGVWFSDIESRVNEPVISCNYVR